MKPDVYYENKNNHIAWKGSYIANELYGIVAANSNSRMTHLKTHVLDFIGLAPDVSDEHTDQTWVSTWKYVYQRTSDTIRAIKNQNYYNNDAKLNELRIIARALGRARPAASWID